MVSTGLAEGSPDLAAFHGGERAALEQVYRDHYARVMGAAARVLRPVDAETVAHEVFHRLIASAEMRGTFIEGDLGAWLVRVATNLAIDHRRRYAREEELSPEHAAPVAVTPSEDAPERLSAQIVIERFRRDGCPRSGRGSSRHASSVSSGSARPRALSG